MIQQVDAVGLDRAKHIAKNILVFGGLTYGASTYLGNNKIVYEKVINFISKDTSFLYDNIIYKNQDYWRCFYNNEIFNVPIDKMLVILLLATKYLILYQKK